MPDNTTEDIIRDSARAIEPSIVEALAVRPGGVDPLGLRQTNFQLMDTVFPGLNNVAQHIRPFVVIAWAWRRAEKIAESKGHSEVHASVFLDFASRIETIFVWSQLLINPDVPLPGKQKLAPFVQKDRFDFFGSEWEKLKNEAEYSTSLRAAINYGPGVRALGWMEAHDTVRGILVPSEVIMPALDALTAKLEPWLEIPAFAAFGKVSIDRAEVEHIGAAWDMTCLSDPEKEIGKRLILGNAANEDRRAGFQLLKEASAFSGSTDIATLRSVMAGGPSNFMPSSELETTLVAWRSLQARQLFRFALEAMFYWIVCCLDEGPSTTNKMSKRFIGCISAGSSKVKTADWLASVTIDSGDPVGAIERLETSLEGDPESIPKCIASAIAVSLEEAPNDPFSFEGRDRLPMATAKRDADELSNAPAEQFVSHVLESWVFAQHVYWSVGRGMADARSRGKSILRLRVVLEEDGWSLAPGATATKPYPTQDRLGTAVSLAQQCCWI